jgi:hypothetical protein
MQPCIIAINCQLTHSLEATTPRGLDIDFLRLLSSRISTPGLVIFVLAVLSLFWNVLLWGFVSWLVSWLFRLRCILSWLHLLDSLLRLSSWFLFLVLASAAAETLEEARLLSLRRRFRLLFRLFFRLLLSSWDRGVLLCFLGPVATR